MKKLYIHILLILLFLSIPILSSPDFDHRLSMMKVPMFQRNFLEMILLILFFYLNFFVLMPFFYHLKKYVLFGVFAFVSYAFVVLIPYFLVQENTPHFPIMPHPEFKNDFLLFDFTKSLLPFLFSLISSSYLFLNIKKREIEMLKNKAELLSLRYQLQPHFLFNTLNNIYSLSILKSDEAPNSILKLSNVMRYVVDKANKDFVNLKEEMQYLDDYISLQLTRTDESLDFQFHKDIRNGNLNIAPMILVNFIENAFKYGFNAEEQSKIMISISTEGNTLHFLVKNKIVNRNLSEHMSTKIGIRNTVERLKELYKNTHKIEILMKENDYEVQLKIELSEN